MKIAHLINNPDNPRTINEDKFNKLINSLILFPKMLEYEKLTWVNRGEEKVVIGGNMRLRAIRAILETTLNEVTRRINDYYDPNDKEEKERIKDSLNRWKEMFRKGTLKDEYHQNADNMLPAEQEEFIVKDNTSYGTWNFDELANMWDPDKLELMGVDIPGWNRSKDYFADVDDSEEDVPSEESDFEEKKESEVPRKTHDKFSEISFVIEHDRKLEVLEVLNGIKQEFGYSTHVDALYFLIKNYKENA
jgi:hypothetical protein